MDSNDGNPWSKALISNRYSSNTSLVKSFKTLMSPESGSIPKYVDAFSELSSPIISYLTSFPGAVPSESVALTLNMKNWFE